MKIITDPNVIDRKKWSSFVRNHPRGNVFQTPEMYDVFLHTLNYHPMVFIAEDELSVKGVLLAVVMNNGHCLLRLFTARSIIIGGPLASDNQDEIIKQLMVEYKKCLPRHVIYSEIRPVFDLSDSSGMLMEVGFERKGHYNVLIVLQKSVDELYKKVRKERRRHISQAERAGLRFSEVFEKDSIYSIVRLIKETYIRKHVPLSDASLFYNAARYMPQNIRFFAVHKDDDIIAGQVALCYNGLVYAWYTGSDEKSLNLRPNDLLMWRFIQWANENGYNSFDFGGGGEPGVPYGVRDYKMTFGAELFDFGRYELIHRPVIYKLGRFVLGLTVKK